jgi:hypothetical protein
VRIAVSGSHGSGKTTLVEGFAAAHPAYRAVPEPYETLTEAGSAFSDPPTVDDYLEQLDHSIAALLATESGGEVIFDRCPVDFVAYLRVAGRRIGEGEAFDVEDVLDEVRDAVATLDLIVFLPLSKTAVLEAEYPALQRAVDRELREILSEDSLSLFEAGAPRVAVLRGSPTERLRALERAVARLAAGEGADA